jgi:hypothetical protein
MIHTKECVVSYLTSSELRCVTPKVTTASAVQTKIIVNGTQSNQQTYTYSSSSPQITSFTPKSMHPGFKYFVTITGSNFPTTTLSEIDVQIFPTNKSQPLAPFDCYPYFINATHIKCSLPGGEYGSYSLKVNFKSTGDTNALPDLVYESYISAITTREGSVYGGSKIVIQGVNLGEEKDSVLVSVRG